MKKKRDKVTLKIQDYNMRAQSRYNYWYKRMITFVVYEGKRDALMVELIEKRINKKTFRAKDALLTQEFEKTLDEDFSVHYNAIMECYEYYDTLSVKEQASLLRDYLVILKQKQEQIGPLQFKRISKTLGYKEILLVSEGMGLKVNIA